MDVRLRDAWLLYYSAPTFLIDKSVLDMTATQAAAIAFGSLVISWLVYEGLCRSPLGRHEVALALVGYVYLVALTYGFTHVFSGLGAFTQIGALIGTIMVANVFVIIIPYQKKTVEAMLAGKEPDPVWGQLGKQRSVHNNYLTLPVVFLMLSNHYPLFFATRYNWLIVAIVLADRAGHPPLLQLASRGPGQPVVDLGCCSRRYGGGRVALRGRPGRDIDWQHCRRRQSLRR